MTKDYVRLRYDGEALADHSMDVADLAPALLALGDLCTRANRLFNQDRSAVKVLVNADLDQNCFEIYIELAQTIYEQAKSLIKDDDVATAKEILEWLGIVAGSALAPIGLFKLVKLLNGKKIQSKELVVENGRDVIQIKIEGNTGTVNVHPQTLRLAEDKKSMKAVQKVVEPVTRDGYSKVEFEHDGTSTEVITKVDAESIVKIDIDEPIEEIEVEGAQTITAWIRVYSPVYERNAPTWRFEYGERHEYMDISETDIVDKALLRGGALMNDTYRVKLEITQKKTESGTFKNHYKIKEVLDFKGARLVKQDDMFDGE